MVRLHTVIIRPPWETLGVPEEEWPAFLAGLDLGRDHLVSRDQLEDTAPPRGGLEQEERDFLESLVQEPDQTVSVLYKNLGLSARKGSHIRLRLKQQGLLVEVETRLGQGGRRAKYLVPTFEALDMLDRELPPGRGSPVHRYVQQLVAQSARKKGYKAEVEKELPDGSAVDVHLENDGYRVAVRLPSCPVPSGSWSTSPGAWKQDTTASTACSPTRASWSARERP